MSKIVAGTAFVLLGGATATGGVFLYKNAKSSSGPGEQKPQTKEQVDATLSETLDKFKSEGKNNHCIKKLFSGLNDLNGSGATEAAATDFDANFFGTEASNTTTGCLVVNWDKDTSTKNTETNKWKGNIRFLWAATGSNNQGFIAYLSGTATNDSSTHSIKWTGVAYTLSSANSSWTINKKRDVPNPAGTDVSFKKDTGNTEDNKKKFPGPGAALNMGANSDFWGFFGSADDLANICSSSECTDGTTKSTFRGYWDWSGKYDTTASDGRKKLSDWTQDLEKCCQAIFGTQCKAKSAADQQFGTWTEVVKTNTPPVTSAS